MTKYVCISCKKLITGNSLITTDNDIFCSPCATELIKRGNEDAKELRKEMKMRQRVIDLLNSI